MIALLVLLQLATPSTGDLSFLVGRWEAEGVLRPGTAREAVETGERNCEALLGGEYIRCVTDMTSAAGRRRTVISYHNWNGLNGRFENLWIASGWPTKVMTHGLIALEGGRIVESTEGSFQLPDGATEFVRSRLVAEGGTITSDEEIRTSVDPEWRLNYRLTLRRSD